MSEKLKQAHSCWKTPRIQLLNCFCPSDWDPLTFYWRAILEIVSFNDSGRVKVRDFFLSFFLSIFLPLILSRAGGRMQNWGVRSWSRLLYAFVYVYTSYLHASLDLRMYAYYYNCSSTYVQICTYMRHENTIRVSCKMPSVWKGWLH